MRDRGMRLVAGIALCVALASPVRAMQDPVPEQEREEATLVGTVFNAMTGEPVEGALVQMLGSGRGALTQADGAFTIEDTWAGRDSIEVRFIGYDPSRTYLDLEPGTTTRVTLSLTRVAVRVADLVVEVRQNRTERNLSGVTRRLKSGFGTFFSPREIRLRQPRLPSDLFRGEPGVTFGRIEYGRAEIYLGRGADRRCPPALFLDGVYQLNMQIDDLPRDELGAVEVYKRHSDIPSEFLRSTSTCGVILVWSPASPEFQEWAADLEEPF